MKASIGDSVCYVDEFSKHHNAIVTANWSNTDTGARNVVYVTDDESKTDSYGRQILRATSVVHKSEQSAPGRYWE